MQPPVVTMMHLIFVMGDADQANALISVDAHCSEAGDQHPTPPAPNADTPLIPGEPAHDPFAREIEADIADFCNKHPDELFCGKLARWMRQHGKTNP